MDNGPLKDATAHHILRSRPDFYCYTDVDAEQDDLDNVKSKHFLLQQQD